MTDVQAPDVYTGRTAVDQQGNKIGSVGQVYVNDQTGQPDWITVNTGLFGMRENFVPLQGSSFNGDDLVLPFDKDVVKDAPEVDDASHLDIDEQQELYGYYRQYLTGTGVGSAGTLSGGGAVSGRASDLGSNDTRSSGQGFETSGPTTDDAMTRSEEHLQVGTEQVEAGRARLRKYVVTEDQTVTVPVTHEEVRIEREPITDSNRDEALAGPEISEEEHEVVLHAERPVVQTEAVPVERVRLGTETVTDQETVTGEVRKEQIELTDDNDDSLRRGDSAVDPADYPQNR